MDELNEIIKIRNKMTDEIIVLMNRKKIKKKDMLKVLETTLPTLNKAMDGGGNDELLAKALEYCRNYKAK